MSVPPYAFGVIPRASIPRWAMDNVIGPMAGYWSDTPSGYYDKRKGVLDEITKYAAAGAH